MQQKITDFVPRRAPRRRTFKDLSGHSPACLYVSRPYCQSICISNNSYGREASW